MKALHTFAGIVATLATIIILLISSVECAAYLDWNYYEREYERLHVLDDVNMTMEDLMEVTHEMMDYLRGDREDLVVETTIDGTRQEFFNEQEKLHMADVRVLFIGGLILRTIAIVLLILSILFLILTHAPFSQILPRYFQRGAVLFFIITGILGGLFASDFTRYFTIFHEIFFNNDLWLMDPATSRLINIVPEPFWVAVALRVALIFVGFMAVCFLGCVIWRIVAGRKQARKPA